MKRRNGKTLKVVCTSDTHARHEKLEVPAGDIFIHAGDLCLMDGSEVRRFNDWLGTLPHRHKFVIAGNHDFLFEQEGDIMGALLTNAVYLENAGAEAEGLLIWGSPISPEFAHLAFNRDRGAEIRRSWDCIPAKTDVLITHGPPRGILDRTLYDEHVGCDDLLAALKRVRPRMHVFGHIHEAYGVVEIDGTVYVNASASPFPYKRDMSAPIVVSM